MLHSHKRNNRPPQRGTPGESKEIQPLLWRCARLVLLAFFYGFLVSLWLMGGLTPDPAKGFLFSIFKRIS